MGQIYPAATIAKWFIAWAEAVEDELSNMKLQKILYYAQGHHLGLTGKPLFKDQIQAWIHGPVVADIYHRYKHFGSSAISMPDDDSFLWDHVDPDTANFLERVWVSYGGYSAGRLRTMSHSEPPWRDHFDGEHYVIIPQDSMREFFRPITLKG